jgi:hypothetical protein
MSIASDLDLATMLHLELGHLVAAGARRGRYRADPAATWWSRSRMDAGLVVAARDLDWGAAVEGPMVAGRL